MKYNIRCDNCGQFISYKSIEQNKVSHIFIPDSDVSYEENIWRCEKCTMVHGKPVTNQQFYPK